MFAIIDIETCGAKFEFRRGRIIDICILVHDGISVVEQYQTLVNPNCYISPFYTNLSGITNEMVADAPQFHEIAKDIIRLTADKIFVAHNVGFDYRFIQEEFASLGYAFKRDTLCTVKLSRKLLPGKKSYSLGNLCAAIGIEIFDRHRAAGDAIATAKLFDLLLQLKTQSPQYKSQSVDQIMRTRIDQIKKYILDKLPDSCGVYYFLNKEHQIIYIGKSIHMYTRAVSHFNTDIRKMKNMLHQLYNVDYVETGSELISLLMESEEIKKHKPFFNRKSKVDVFTHSLIHSISDTGVHEIYIDKYDEQIAALCSFTNYASAREKLDQWISTYTLCLRYCRLTSNESVCFHHQIKQCNGICAELEDKTAYNKRVQQLLQAVSYPLSCFIIVDVGRTPNEKSFVWIDNFQYKGYGYFDESAQIMHAGDIPAWLHSQQYYPDCDALIRSWIRQKKPKLIAIPPQPHT